MNGFCSIVFILHLIIHCVSCALIGSRNKMSDILSLDAISISNLIKSKELTSVELMTRTLDQIELWNPKVNAIIALRNREELLSEAHAADNAPTHKGWLHGIPIAIKDMSNTAGILSTKGGSSLYATNIPNEDDIYIKHLREKGVIIIGKTNAPEMGLGSHTYNSMWGMTRNPYDPFKSAGGSSGGAAVALASRMLCLADGSDMMGSLRNPAGWNNVYSIRPTAGLIPKDASVPSSKGEDMPQPPSTVSDALPYPISTVGPMARTPTDLSVLLQTMAGQEEQLEDVKSVLAESLQQLKHKRIGWLADWGGAYPMEKGVLSLCETSLHVFKEQGFIVEKVEQAPFSAVDLWKSWTTIRSHEISSNLIQEFGKEAFIHKDDGDESRPIVKPEVLYEIKRGLEQTDDTLKKAIHIAESWAKCASKMLDNDYDVLALPSAQLFPFCAEWDWPKAINGISMDSYHRWMEVVVPVTLIGLPCVTVPAGFGGGDDGCGDMPMGLQLFSARGNDLALLGLAQRYHEVTDWPSKRPPNNIK